MTKRASDPGLLQSDAQTVERLAFQPIDLVLLEGRVAHDVGQDLESRVRPCPTSRPRWPRRNPSPPRNRSSRLTIQSPARSRAPTSSPFLWSGGNRSCSPCRQDFPDRLRRHCAPRPGRRAAAARGARPRSRASRSPVWLPSAWRISSRAWRRARAENRRRRSPRRNDLSLGKKPPAQRVVIPIRRRTERDLAGRVRSGKALERP